MDVDENVAAFTSITGASTDQAQQYLDMSNNDLTHAMDLFYNMGGIDLGQAPAVAPTQPNAASNTARSDQEREVISLDSDEENTSQSASRAPGRTGIAASEEDDAAMARRLQEEFYGGGTNVTGGAGGTDAEGYRAPIAPTRETLVGPGSYDSEDPDDMHAAVLEQMRQRRNGRQGRAGRPGIFNQQPAASSIWTESSSSSDRQAELARATGGASERSSKSTMLAEMFRPPFELMSKLSWDDARDEGKENQRWILVNVQDPSIFDCQLLNRDLWKHDGIKETIKENFIFMQYTKDDPRGNQYMQYYFQERDIDSAYPHIAIVDPRTGEQVKVWSGPPAPKAMDFLMQLHEFLDRYSLNAAAKNPVARRKAEPKKESQVDRMTEEEQLEMALQASLTGSREDKDKEADPDDLTRSVDDLNPVEKDDATMTEADEDERNGVGSSIDSRFASISSQRPHEEPPADPSSTRINFRHPNGRSIRRFALQDPVRRLYEWLKASPLEGMDTAGEFDIVFVGRNLIEHLDDTIETAGLKNASVNLEYST